MKRRTCLAVLIAACSFGPSARAEAPYTLFDGCRWHFTMLRDEWRARRCWCPDDYCPKILPKVSCNPKGCVDDYCPKKEPCAPPCAKGCVDDYCPKTCPIVLWNKCAGTCGPPEDCCGPCRHPRGKP